MGQKCTNCREAFEVEYLKKIEGRRRQNAKEINYVPRSTGFKDHIQAMRELADYVFDEKRTLKPVMTIKEQINKFTPKDLSSIISFFAWENEFLQVMHDNKNEVFNYELENKRIAQFMKVENNMITRIISAFDLGIEDIYKDEVSDLLKKCCPKYGSTIGYKRKTFDRMINFMADLDSKELNPLEEPEDRKRCIKIIKEILQLVKMLGLYLTMLIQLLTNQKVDTSKRSENESTTIIINCLMKFNFSFYVFAMFLSRAFIMRDVNMWIQRKNTLLRNQQAFEDLIYLNQFIDSEKDQKVLRQLSRKIMSVSETIIVGDEKKYNYLFAQYGQKKMDMVEFLAHVNEHLKLDLDRIFFGSLSDIMFFFQKIEEFMDKVFHNAELEIKIDLIRVILRVNNSSEFFYRIFLINLMDLGFLTSCQIFALFNQVLICSELKIKTKV